MNAVELNVADLPPGGRGGSILPLITRSKHTTMILEYLLYLSIFSEVKVCHCGCSFGGSSWGQ